MLPGDSDRARGNGMELCQGRGSWGLGKGSAQERGGYGRASQSSGHGPELLQMEDCLHLGGPLWSEGLDLIILVGPSNLRYSYNHRIIEWPGLKRTTMII